MSKIENLIRVLQQAGFNSLEADDIADILWLAKHLPPPTDEPPEDSKDRSKGDTPTESLRKDSTLPEESKMVDGNLPKPQRASKLTQLASRNMPARAGVYVPTDTSKSAGGLSFQSPGVSALPEKRRYERALRPLLRRVPSENHFLLDEEATVHRIADTLTWLPVMRPDSSRWLELDVVIDEWPSLVLWRDSINELITLLTNLGAFRSVQVWSIWTTVDAETKHAEVEFRSGWGSAGAAGFARPPKELISIRGNRLVLLISDCISAAWYNGAIAGLLSEWISTEMVVLLQVLPETYWRRTGLVKAIPAYFRMTQPGQPNNQLTLIPDPAIGQPLPPKGIPLPILPLDPQLIAVWAQAAAGHNNLWVPAVMLPTLDNWQKTPPKQGDDDRAKAAENKKKDPLAQAQFLMDRFRQSASPEAWKLAVYLSAASPLNLPVMRLIQETMVSGSRLEHVAEFYLSGLIRRVSTSHALVEANARYEFAPGVRKLLLADITRAEVADVLRKTTRFVNRNTGKPMSFDAIVADPSLVSQLDLESAPFAQLSQNILRMLGGEFARLATALADRQLSEEIEEQATPQESTEEEKGSSPNLFNTLTLELQELAGSKSEVSGAARALDALTKLQIKIANPGGTFLHLTSATLENSGISLNGIQRQVLARADFYSISFSVAILNPPNTNLEQLNFLVEFESDPAAEPLIRSMYPTSEWRGLLGQQQEFRLELTADLNWRLNPASTEKQSKGKAGTRQQGPAAGNRESPLAYEFTFPLKPRELAATGVGTSRCFWSFQSPEFRDTATLQFGVIFEVPKGTGNLKIAARATANPSVNWLTQNLRGIVNLLGDRLRNSLRPGKNEQFTIADSSIWTLQLPGAATAPEPSAIKKKVRVLVFRPDAVARFRTRMNDPQELAEQYIESLNELSRGIVQYDVVKSEEIRDYPPFENGRRYTDATWTQAMEDPEKALRNAGGYLMADYQAILKEFNIVPEIQAGEIDEVWLFGAPFFGFYESRMVGQAAYWCNSPPLELNSRTFIVMGFSYERGLLEMLEGFGHRVEAILARTFNSQTFLQMLERAPGIFTSQADLPSKPQNDFERFLLEHGTVHRKPNEGMYSQDKEAWLRALHDEWWSEVLLPDSSPLTEDSNVPGESDRLRVLLAPGDARLASELSQSSLLKIVSGDTSDVDVEVVTQPDGSWSIGNDLEPVLALVPRGEMRALREGLEWYYRYQTVLNLARNYNDPQLNRSLSVRLLDCSDTAALQAMTAEELANPNLREVNRDEQGIYFVQPGTRLCVEITNRSSQTLHVTLLDCSAGGLVQHMGDALLRPGTSHILWSRDEPGSGFPASLDELPVLAGVSALPYVTDRLIAFGTTRRDVDLNSLTVDKTVQQVVEESRTRRALRSIEEDSERALDLLGKSGTAKVTPVRIARETEDIPDEPVASQTTVKEEVVSPAADETWSLIFVQADTNESLRFRVQTGGESFVEFQMGVQKRNFDTLLAQALEDPRSNQELGYTLFELMIPNRLKDMLRELDNVLFILDPETTHYPWEMLYDRRADPDNPLFVRVGMVRQFRIDSIRAGVTNVRNNNILVVGDPANLPEGFPSLPGAQQEASLVAAKFQKFEYNVHVEIHTGAASILNSLFANDYRILHLSGHGVYRYSVQPADRERSVLYSGIMLGDGVFLTANEIRNKREMPELVFINCPHTGKPDSPGDPDAYQYNILAASLAEELSKMGVKAVIAADWATDDAAALTFTDAFYDHMLKGDTFGNAVRAARAETYELHGERTNTWAAYQCYGDPNYRLVTEPYEKQAEA